MRHGAIGSLVLVSTFILSCASIPRYVNPAARGSPSFSVHVWVQEGLPADVAVAGCEVWREKGVACTLVSDPEYADIRVHADHRPCVAHDGLRTLAEAWQGGKVVFYTSCLAEGDGRLDRDEFRTVMGHEVGHEIGIWEHVPLECGDHALRHPNGQRICGRAIMNPLYDKDVSFITPIDSLAFDMRDPMISVLIETSDRSEPEQPSCVYRVR